MPQRRASKPGTSRYRGCRRSSAEVALMLRTGLVLFASLTLLTPAAAIAANEIAASNAGVAIDASVLTDAKVERNGKHIGTVQRVMVNPTTGRIDHVHILM